MREAEVLFLLYSSTETHIVYHHKQLPFLFFFPGEVSYINHKVPLPLFLYIGNILFYNCFNECYINVYRFLVLVFVTQHKATGVHIHFCIQK